MNLTKNHKEEVMVFPAHILDELGRFQGLNFDIEKYLEAINQNLSFKRRESAEKDKSYKQLIPYVILHNNGKIFSYKRGKLLSENRLKGNYSIGVGGHISRKDEDLFVSKYQKAMHREVREEITINSEYTDYNIALLNDDSNEVGQVHLGLIHLFDLKTPDVAKKEKSINEPNFIPIKELLKELEKYENWSKICLENIEKILAKTVT